MYRFLEVALVVGAAAIALVRSLLFRLQKQIDTSISRSRTRLHVLLAGLGLVTLGRVRAVVGRRIARFARFFSLNIANFMPLNR